jgi:hypothetical protein
LRRERKAAGPVKGDGRAREPFQPSYEKVVFFIVGQKIGSNPGEDYVTLRAADHGIFAILTQEVSYEKFIFSYTSHFTDGLRWSNAV